MVRGPGVAHIGVVAAASAIHRLAFQCVFRISQGGIGQQARLAAPFVRVGCPGGRVADRTRAGGTCLAQASVVVEVTAVAFHRAGSESSLRRALVARARPSLWGHSPQATWRTTIAPMA